MMIKAGIMGAGGRMGGALIRAIAEADDIVVAAALERPDHDAQDRDAGRVAGLDAVGVVIASDPDQFAASVDVILDFTAPAASIAMLSQARRHGTAHLLGTTGLSAGEQQKVAAAAAQIPVLQAANMSLGVNLLLQLTRQAAQALKDDFDIEIVEMHHRHKVDAPSGTALALGQAAAEGRQVAHDAVADRGRDGITGARKRGDIGYAVLRGGNVAGEHSVVFAADDERIELTHRAGDRAIFARGAVRAGRWLAGKPPGLYSMTDVLNLR